MVTIEDHQALCSEATWNTMMHYAKILKKNKIKIAFFSATPQGGGVALMRHAREYSLPGVTCFPVVITVGCIHPLKLRQMCQKKELY
jgi:hypothetical protein